MKRLCLPIGPLCGRFSPPLRGICAGGIVGAALIGLVSSVPASAYPRPGETERVSVASGGTEADRASRSAEFYHFISADGRLVAFRSAASNLVPGDRARSGIFVHDRQEVSTKRVSQRRDGRAAQPSGIAVISADGRFVAFESRNPRIVLDDTNQAWDIFVHDRQKGTTERVSVASDGTQGNDSAFRPAISADGRFVAFYSRASNLVPDDTNSAQDIFVHDRQKGTTERVSVASDGSQGRGVAHTPSISADGRFVAFDSFASNLVPGDTNGSWDVFVHDRQKGTTERVSVASDGKGGNSRSQRPSISADGRFVAFHGNASNLVPGDTNGDEGWDSFVHDRQTGTTERVSVASDGAEVKGPSLAPAISADGRFVAFESYAPNLVPGDTNGGWDSFVHDRQTGTTERVSVASDGTQGNDYSRFTGISADGRHVAFESAASNLVPGDTNQAPDVFLRERGPAVGVGGLEARRKGDAVMVSGWVTLAGATVAKADDPPDDAAGASPVGSEIAAASVVYRPEQPDRPDLLLRLRLASLPGSELREGLGIVYRWVFTIEGRLFEARAVAATTPRDAPPHFALYDCSSSCTEIAPLSGAIGTTGPEVWVSVPLETLGRDPRPVAEGTTLTGLEASTGIAGASSEPFVPLDRVALPDAPIPVHRVDLGIAPVATPGTEVAFSTPAKAVEGRFRGTVDASRFAAGGFRVWARACLGAVCGARSADGEEVELNAPPTPAGGER